MTDQQFEKLAHDVKTIRLYVFWLVFIIASNIILLVLGAFKLPTFKVEVVSPAAITKPITPGK